MHLVRHQHAQGARRHGNPAAAVAVSARRAEAQAQLILLMEVAWDRARGPWWIAVPLQDDIVVDASPDVLGAAVSRRPAPAAIGHDRMLRDCRIHHGHHRGSLMRTTAFASSAMEPEQGV